MDNTALTCRDEQRRVIARQRNFNGIDYVSIGADQTSLCVHLFGEYPSGIDTANVRLEGGRRVRDIKVLSVSPEQEEDPELGECLHIELDKAGDFSTYKLCLVEVENGRPTRNPLQGVDPRYSCIEFSFKVDCLSDLDCKDEQSCPPEEERAPDINYLAKDYASFRQLILDRLALLMPDWRERHVPDIGILLVELLAYVGDYLSYYQDAVATEAYLDTARQRISVRRHARLVDYQMHEGCNARAFVYVKTDVDLTLDPQRIYFITLCAELDRAGKWAISADEFDLFRIPSNRYDVFMPMIASQQACDLGELKSVSDLMSKLRDPKDQFATKLRPCLSSNTQHLLAAWDVKADPSDALRATLTDEWERLHSSNIYLYEAHSTIFFYTWGDAECCLPRGATKATLRDEFKKPTSTAATKAAESYSAMQPAQMYVPAKDESQAVEQRELDLAVGDVLIFEEVIGPKTNNPAVADPAHRHAVRLTKVEPDLDPLFNQPVVEIEWAEEDALPFTLCISAVLPAPDCQLVEGISVARGNVVLVDHGQAIDPPEPLGQVPLHTTVGECECGAAEMSKVAGKFRPRLKGGPLTFSEPLDARLPAAKSLTQDPRRALPQITRLTGLPDVCGAPDEPGREAARVKLLAGVSPGDSIWQWYPQRDLLSSESTDRHFVAEVDNDGYAHLRFGDGELGRKPDACTSFTATYRVGNGSSGNVGADTIRHLVFRDKVSDGSLEPRNPLPARGGSEAEPMSEVKLFASGALRKDLQRAIVADDYARLAERNRKLQKAAAELRWTGSWYEARVAIDPHDTTELAGALLQEIAGDLHSYHRVGHDLAIVPADYAPLEIELTVCVLAHYQRGHVEAALLESFSNRILPGGKRGFFQPDELTFGSDVYLSRLIATAQAVQGVESVTVKVLKRRFLDPSGEIESGVLPLEATEVARLDNDLSFPENGKLTLKMIGGR